MINGHVWKTKPYWLLCWLHLKGKIKENLIYADPFEQDLDWFIRLLEKEI